MERKEYEAPKVTRVEIDFNDRVIAAGCSMTDTKPMCDPWDYSSS